MKSAAVFFAFLGSATAFPETCPNVTLIHGVKGNAWYDACLGLNFKKDAADAAACKQQCYTDMNCSVWQFINDNGNEKCWSGNVVHGCLSRQTAGTALSKFEGDLVDGERIQHGFIKVVADNSNLETMGLKNYPEKTGTDEEKTLRCKEFCYTDVTCTVWQYGSDGCWLEHYPSNPKGETKTDSDWAKAMIAGQTIEHTCPPYVPPEEGLPWAWIIAGIILALLALAAIIYAMQKKPKVKKTRAVKVEPKAEPEPQLVYLVQQPTVLVPQQSVVASYSPVAAAPMVSTPTYAPVASAPMVSTPTYAPVASGPIIR